jgi:hypothetical protein
MCRAITWRWSRCGVLRAARAVRGEPPGRGRPDGGVRHRPAAARHRRACAARPAQDAAALERRGVIVAASFWAINTPQPDVLISSDGQAVAVRGADGRFSIHRGGRDSAFAAANGSPPTAMPGCRTTRIWGRASAAIPPDASPGLPTASSSGRCSPPMPSRSAMQHEVLHCWPATVTKSMSETVPDQRRIRDTRG